MTEKDFKNATKIDNADLVRNTMKSDPSQNGSPIPFQSGYSTYEAKKGTQSSLEVIAFYFLGIIFSVTAYYCLINLSILIAFFFYRTIVFEKTYPVHLELF
ncbi:hypothetical protein [Candidatus Enterococcus lemimoniae]|uniref:Uncharacterized protein n=1 Tax=Candidatus Enterococcus lemimoniae TaxID=1834167 RepID=A0ABZ2T0S3_9ENTE